MGRTRKQPTARYMALGGPFDGETLLLTKGTDATAWFAVGRWHGRYKINGKAASWQPHRDR